MSSLCGRHCTGHLHALSHFHSHPRSWQSPHPHFTDQEYRAQGDQLICPRSQGCYGANEIRDHVSLVQISCFSQGIDFWSRVEYSCSPHLLGRQPGICMVALGAIFWQKGKGKLGGEGQCGIKALFCRAGWMPGAIWSGERAFWVALHLLEGMRISVDYFFRALRNRSRVWTGIVQGGQVLFCVRKSIFCFFYF